MFNNSSTNKYESPQFSSKNVREGFQKKVLFTVGWQLALTMLLCLVISQSYFLLNLSFKLFYVFVGGMIAIQIAFMCCQEMMRKHPLNYYGLLAFTVCQSFALAVILQSFSDEAVFKAVLGTGVTVGAIGFYAYKSKHELISSRFFFVFTIVQLVYSLFSLFFFGANSTVYQILSSIGVVAYLIIDLQMLLGRGNYKFTIDDHCYAALMIYVDIIQIFLKILSLLDDSNKNKKKNKNQ